ncbi:cation diffusion facilitator family transporter [Tyzzerella sp. OttesenSCG-928-J15]|nr:cation diffusion facilitator family transporter [Tyzzerella sp. OttesenSCG-928-J15]
MDSTKNEKLAMEISAVTIVANIILSVFKLIAGVLGKSSAMISDAVHSASDVISTVIVIIGVKISSRDADEGHPYGHERFECVAAIVLAVILCFTGLGIGYSSAQKVFFGNEADLTVPGILPLAAAIVSIAVKEGMYHYTKRGAKRINSGALMADAWHHRSDALSSIGSFVGIAGARLGMPILDPLAGIVICLFIVKAAADIFIDAVKKMTDTACDSETTEKIRSVIRELKGILEVDMIKTRIFGDKIYVDIEISVCGDVPLSDAHDIAELVHNEVESKIPNVKHCMVHVNPGADEPA